MLSGHLRTLIQITIEPIERNTKGDFQDQELGFWYRSSYCDEL